MHRERIIEILSALVAFDTTSRNTNLPLIDWMEDLLRPLGFAVERVPDETGLKANLLATIGPADVPGVILSGHTDVVPVEGQSWTSDPFVLRRDGGRLYGRGACDMKGFLAVCLALAEPMARARLTRPIHLAFSYDEEVGCIGGRRLAEHLATRAVRPLFCFVGEPSGMGIVTGHKGKRSMRADVRGLTCHSSLAPFGVNAVEYGALLVAEIRRMTENLAREGARDEAYDVPFSTGHVGIFRGGTTLNIVPDACEIVFEFRTLPADDPDALVAAVQRYAATVLEPAMKKIDPATGFAFTAVSTFPGLDTDPESGIVALSRALTGANSLAKVAYGTEAGLFDSVAGVPSVILGPGSIEQAHKADEWVAIDDLERCAAFVERLIAHCGE